MATGANPATRALVKFIGDHRGQAHADLGACLTALEGKNVERAVYYARRVKPAGMGGIPTGPTCDVRKRRNEDEEYVTEVLVALVNHWARLMCPSFNASAG